MIGKRLKLARTASGLSLRALEEKIDHRVTAQAIGKYERDESMPGSQVLMALATALGVTLDYLVGDPEWVLHGVAFQNKRITSRKERARIEATVLHGLERYLMVEALLNLPSVEWDPPWEAPYAVRALAETEHAAQGLRQHWGLGLEPVPHLAEVFEEHGLKVLAVDLTCVGGLTVHVRRGGHEPLAVIMVNRQDQGECQRFTLAHELGNLLLDVADNLDKEKVSDRFAGALLMPAENLWAKTGKHRTAIGWPELFELKALFGVSVQALTDRCKALGIFSDRLCHRLHREFAHRGWGKPPAEEPLALPGDESHRFERLCYRALAEGAVSEAKAAELLGMSVHELNQRMDEPPGETGRWPRAVMAL